MCSRNHEGGNIIMRPLYLELSAFGPYREKVQLDFTKLNGYDFFLIHGATGAGKTSIFDAICYALYGRTATQDRNGEMLRNQSASLDTPTYVKLKFALNDTIWQIRRQPEYTRRAKRGDGIVTEKKSAALDKLNAAGEIIKSWERKEIDAKIQAMIGFSVEQFRQVVLLPQGQFQRFLKAGTIERREIMKVLFNTERYEKLENKLKERANSLEKDCKKIDTKIQNSLEVYGAEDMEAFASILAAKQQKLVEQADLAAEFMQKLSTAAKAKTLADQLQVKFKALDEAKNEFSRASKQQEADAALSEQLIIAQKVLSLSDIIKQKAVVEADLQDRQANLAKLRQEGQASKIKLADLAAEEKRYEEQKSSRQARRKALTLLEKSLHDAETLINKEQDLARVTASLADLKQQKNKAASKLVQIKTTYNQAQQEYNKVIEKTAKLAAAKVELANLQNEKKQIISYEQMKKAAADIEAKLIAAKADYDKSSKAYQEAAALLDEKETLLKTARAAMLAENLQEGEACPVCGALHHPELAKFVVEKITDEDIEKQKKELLQKEQTRDGAQAVYNNLKAEQSASNAKKAALEASLTNIAGKILLLTEINSLIAKKQAAIAALEQAEKRQAELTKILQTSEKTEQDLTAKEAELQEQILAVEKETAELQALCAKIKQDLPAEAGNPVELKQNYRKQEQALIAEETAAEKAQKALMVMQEEHTKRQSDYAIALKEKDKVEINLAQITTELTERCASLNITPAMIEKIKASKWHDRAYCEAQEALLKQNEVSFKAAKANLSKYQEELATATRPDFAEINAQYKQLQNELKNIHSEQGALQNACQEMLAVAKNVDKLNAVYQKKSQTYTIISELADIANGKNTGRKISFQSYVLNAALNDVLNSANVRLRSMTHERYYLRLGKARDNRSDGGLELAIFDNYNGSERAVQTLSGGESFLASLALALGLADTVQQYAGGIRLDTMFIDEGFGTLDQSTLDDALNALFEVQRNGRMVGIISHVEELKKRIPARLEVKKSRIGGSTAQIVIGTADD